jgi:hypothetical protein
MGVASSLVMDGEVSAHSSRNKIVLHERTDKGKLLRSGQFNGQGHFNFSGKLGGAGLLDLLHAVPEGGAVCKLWRGVRGQHDFCMDNTTFACVVMGQAVPLVHQFFAAPICGSGHGGLALAPLDDLDWTVKNCRKKAPPSSVGYWPRRKVTDAQRVSLSGGGARGLGSAAPHRARRAQQPPAGRTTPERCISAPFSERTTPRPWRSASFLQVPPPPADGREQSETP